MKSKIFSVLLVMSILLTACSNDSSNAPNSKIGDSESKVFLFTANEGGSITKVNASNNEVISTIQVDGAVHNVQLSPDGKVLAATVVPAMARTTGEHDESDDDEHGMDMNGKVQFYDSAKDQLIKTVEVGVHPAHVVYTHNGKYALVTNNESNNVTVIDTSSYAIVTTVDTGKGPHGFRIAPDDQFAYIANMGENTVSVIDLAAMKESRRIKVGTTPVTTGVTSDGKTLAVTLNGENSLAIIDLSNDQVYKIGVGEGPAQVYIQADDKYAFVANQGTPDQPSRTITKIDLNKRKAISTIETGNGAHGVTISPDMSKIYVTNMFDNTLSVIDNSTDQVITTITTGKTPNGVTITPN